VPTFEALADIVTWLLTARVLYCLYRQYMGKYKPQQVGLTAGEKVVQCAKNMNFKEKMTQVKDSCTSVFRHLKRGRPKTSNTDAGEKDKHTTTSTVGSISNILKHRSIGTGNVVRKSRDKKAVASPPALSTDTEQKTDDSMVYLDMVQKGLEQSFVVIHEALLSQILTLTLL
jgi:hypothetical protein